MLNEKKKISVCMIVKNEEKFLKRCLTSLQGKVDEIIVVDTGSTDSTIAIAKQFNTRIYNFKWNNDFAEARNESLSYATGDYILVLDADEYLDADADLHQTLTYEKDYYIINIKNEIDNNYFINHQAIRLFKNKIGFRYVGSIHEHLNTGDYTDKTNALSDINLIHTGYKKSVVNDQNKNQRNLKLLLREVDSNPNAYNYFNLGIQYKVLGQYEIAFECLKKSFNCQKDSVYMPYLLYHMTDCLYQLKKVEDGIILAIDAIASFPNYPDLYYVLGLLYREYGYYNDAKQMFIKAINIGDIKDNPTLEGVGSYLSSYNLAEICHQQGEALKSIEYITTTLSIKKNFTPALVLFLRILEENDIGLDGLFQKFMPLVNIETKDDLNNILMVLFSIRSKLFHKIIQSYNVNSDPVGLFINNLYSKHFDNAKEIINKEKSYFVNNIEWETDILILYLKDRDNIILDNIQSENGKNLIYNFKSSYLAIDENVEDDYLFEVFIKLVKLNEVSLIQEILNRINNKEIMIKCLNVLKNYEHPDLKHLFLQNVRLIGDLGNKLLVYHYLRNNINNSLELLIKLSEQNGWKMWMIEVLSIINDKTGNNIDFGSFAKGLKNEFPLSQWIGNEMK
jgi:glycosyltransferase involved in cell wall biosynthesis